MPGHICLHCYRDLKTVQGLRAHTQNRVQCREAWQKKTDNAAVRQYDPDDPDEHPRDDDPPAGWESYGDEGVALEDLEEHPVLQSPPPQDADEAQKRPVPSDFQGDGAKQKQRPRIEEVDDDEEDSTVRDFFPNPAGRVYGHDCMRFKRLNERREAEGVNVYHPFVDQEEWELASCLMTGGISQTKIDEILKLPIVSPS